ncbi:MAG: hypothetical protein R3A51_06165 [Nannocystaceae bacterium]
MSRPSVYIQGPRDRRLEVALAGRLDERRCQRLLTLLRDNLERDPVAGPGTPELLVVIDLGDATTHDAAGRAVMIEVQALLERFRGRCAYITDRPRLRGVVHYVIAYAGAGARARPVESRARANDWLASPAGEELGERAFAAAEEVVQAGGPARVGGSVSGDRPLGVLERGALWAAGVVARAGLGPALDSRVRAELVRRYGLGEAQARARVVELVVDRTLQVFGPAHGHALLSLAALWSGGLAIARGHLYAANLHCLRDRGELLPIDDDEVAAWMELRDRQVLERVRDRLAAEHGELALLVERQHAALGEARGDASRGAVDSRRAGAERDAEASLLRAGLCLHRWFAPLVSLVTDERIDPVDAIIRDRRLATRYAAARAPGRRRRQEEARTPPRRSV